MKKWREQTRGLEQRVTEGRNLAVKILRHEVRKSGQAVLRIALALVFDGFRYAPSDLPRLPGQRWRFSWHDRASLEPLAEHVPVTHAVVALAIQKHSTVLGIAPERLLPAFNKANAPQNAVRDYLLGIYRADRDTLTEKEARRSRLLHHLVESEACVELSRPGTRRSMEEIVYDVGLGAKVDRRFAERSAHSPQEIEAVIAAELDVLAAEHADYIDGPSPLSARVGPDGRAGRLGLGLRGGSGRAVRPPRPLRNHDRRRIDLVRHRG